MADPLKDAAAELRRRIEAAVSEINALPQMAEIKTALQTLNGLEDLMKEQRTPLGEFFGVFVSGDVPRAPQSAAPAVKVDEFFGMKDLEAAKAFLRKSRDPLLLQEIIEGVRAGGGRIESEERVRSGLSRSTLDVVKIGERYGWLDNYPAEKEKRWKGLRKLSVADTVKMTDAVTVKIGEPTKEN
jgi:hypothetical protein